MRYPDNKENFTFKILLEYFAVFSIIITSGTAIINSIFSLVIAALFIILYTQKVNLKYIFYAVIIIFIIWINSYILSSLPFDNKEFLVMCARVLGIAIITSNITINHFKKFYINIIVLLSINSIIWFSITKIFKGVVLPFTVFTPKYGTFYHIIGHTPTNSMGNCGVFWEPGVFQIYINFAIALLLFDCVRSEKNNIKLFLLSVTLFTTFSSMGVICFGILLTFAIFNNKIIIKKNLKWFIIIFILLLIIFEASTGVIRDKIDYDASTGSILSRTDDFIIGWHVISDYPLFGIGIACDSTELYNQYAIKYMMYYKGYSEDLAQSNGLCNMFSSAGIILGSIYLYNIMKKSRLFFQFKSKEMIPIYIVLILFFANEAIMFTPFWIAFLFKWKN